MKTTIKEAFENKSLKFGSIIDVNKGRYFLLTRDSTNGLYVIKSVYSKYQRYVNENTVVEVIL